MINQPVTRESEPAHSQLEARTQAVLLVDDDASVRNLVTRLLTVKGYRVLAADSSSNALLLWEQHCPEISLLLTDMVMPGGISGRELACRCHANNPELKVIFTSGYNMELSAMDGSPQGGISFLQKPYRPEQLLEVVRAVLANSPNTESKPYVASSPR
jgi:DNA-binding NtrC family response regulator